MTEDQHAAPLLLDRRTITKIYGLSRLTIDRLVREGRLPRPIKTGPARNAKRRWHASEVSAAIAAWPRGDAA